MVIIGGIGAFDKVLKVVAVLAGGVLLNNAVVVVLSQFTY